MSLQLEELEVFLVYHGLFSSSDSLILLCFYFLELCFPLIGVGVTNLNVDELMDCIILSVLCLFFIFHLF